ncbi:MAG: hypothetical protein HQ582_08060 [Planctomycetes bacterium]|nr:hypothetical protein [Planctomycetota bacterium]
MSETINVAAVPEHGIVAATVEGRLTVDVARLAISEMAEVSARHHIDLLLLDLRSAKMAISTTDIYFLPSHFADVGLTGRHKLALAVAQDRRDHDFLETVSSNRGYSVRVFEDVQKATSWLKGSAQSTATPDRQL